VFEAYHDEFCGMERFRASRTEGEVECGRTVEAEALSYLAHVQELSRHHVARVSRLILASGFDHVIYMLCLTSYRCLRLQNDINTQQSPTPDDICTNDMESHADLQISWMRGLR
jgi:hypothetical protein